MILPSNKPPICKDYITVNKVKIDIVQIILFIYTIYNKIRRIIKPRLETLALY